jgi:hypothetical protein
MMEYGTSSEITVPMPHFFVVFVHPSEQQRKINIEGTDAVGDRVADSVHELHKRRMYTRAARASERISERKIAHFAEPLPINIFTNATMIIYKVIQEGTGQSCLLQKLGSAYRDNGIHSAPC